MENVIILTVDCLRSDCFDAEHFPESWPVFDEEFAMFERNYANGVATPFSFPGILTGHPVEGDGTLPSGTPTIAELYDGYTWAISNNPHLRPERKYDRGFDFFTDDIRGDGETDSATRSPIELLKQWGRKSDLLHDLYNQYVYTHTFTTPDNLAEHVIAELKSGLADRDGLFWAHFMDPHYKFYPQKITDKDISSEYTDHELWEMNRRYRDREASEADLQYLFELYEETLGYLDRQLADFFAHLKDNDMWEESLLLVLADHGEAFGEHEIYNHQWDAAPVDTLIRTPLVVKRPRERHAGAVFDHLVSNADVVPTLAAELGWDITPPPGTRPVFETGRRVVVSKSNTAVRVITNDGSQIRHKSGRTETQWGSLDQAASDRLEGEQFPHIENLAGDVPGAEQDDMRAVEQRLEALGYK